MIIQNILRSKNLLSLYLPYFLTFGVKSLKCVSMRRLLAITSFRSLGYPPLGTQTITFHLLLSLQFIFFLLCDFISFFSVASFVSFVLPTFLWLNTMLVYSALSFLLQVLCAWIFVIGGKCEFFSLKVIFFFPPKAVFESCWFVMNVQGRIKLLKVTTHCSSWGSCICAVLGTQSRRAGFTIVTEIIK